MTTIERRVHPRAPLIAKVEIETDGYSFLAVTEDISSGGMRIATANPSPVGHTLQLTFVLPGSERRIRVRAIVRHVVKGSAMGVQFKDLAPADLATLRDFLRAASPTAS